ncbi:hypothetical protein PsYK624_163910 [Phanerochaete sordida]|uniref:Uncharacterized protein n=1 Tax=Phanerochaete sordida TaxID=48140 RepID=A0A9P3GSM4_9APHY|nr:hypothetical protein PsYK624_163910 [Phanerochaete sordida]
MNVNHAQTQDGVLSSLRHDLAWLDDTLPAVKRLCVRTSAEQLGRARERICALADLQHAVPWRDDTDHVHRVLFEDVFDLENENVAGVRAMEKEWFATLKAIENTVRCLERHVAVLQRQFGRDVVAAGQREWAQLNDDLRQARSELSSEKMKRIEEERKRLDEEERRLKAEEEVEDYEAACLLLCGAVLESAAAPEDCWSRGQPDQQPGVHPAFRNAAPVYPGTSATRLGLDEARVWNARSAWTECDRASGKASVKELMKTLKRQAAQKLALAHEREKSLGEQATKAKKRAHADRLRALKAEARVDVLSAANAASEGQIEILAKELDEMKKKAEDQERTRAGVQDDVARLRRVLGESKKKHAEELAKQKTVDASNNYDSKWEILNAQALSFSSVPWPMTEVPKTPDDITLVAVRDFLFGQARRGDQAERTIWKEASLRWHPDKFVPMLGRVKESDKDDVERAVNLIAGFLNDLKTEF